MSNVIRNIKVVFSIDRNALNEGQRSLSSLEKRLEGVGGKVNETGAALRSRFTQSVTLGTSRLSALAQGAKAAAANVDDLRASLDKAAKSAGGIKATEAIGRGSTLGGALASVVGRGGGVGESFAVGGDVLGAVEAVIKFREEIGTLAQSLQAAGGITGSLATAGGALAGSLGTVVAVAAPLVLAIGGIALALKNFIDTTDKAGEGLQAVARTQADYYKLLATGTTDVVKKRIEDERTNADALRKARDESQKVIDDTYKQLVETLGDAAGKAAFGRAQVSTLKVYYENIDSLNKQIDDGTVIVNRLQDALDKNAFSANDAAEAQKKLAEAQKQAADEAERQRTQFIDKQLQQEIEFNELAATATKESVKARLETMQREAAVIREQLRSFERLPLAAQPAVESIQRLEARLTELESGTKALTETTLPLIEARDKERAAAERLKGALAGIGQNFLQGAQGLFKGAGNLLTEAIKAEQDRQKRLIDVQQKYEDTRKDIEQNAAQERAALQKRYNDDLVKIAEDAAKRQKDALADLLLKRTDLARDFARGEVDAVRDAQRNQLDAQINFQREEANAAEAHARNLRDIRERANQREADLILNRDFLALFQSRRQTGFDIQNAGVQAQDESRQRASQFLQAQADAARAFEAERLQRQIQYQRNLADAQAAYERERVTIEQQRIAALNTARESYRRELQETQAAARAKLQTLNQGYREELRVAALFAGERIKLETRTQQELLRRAQTTLAAVASQPYRLASYPVRRAGGGPLMAGQLARVDEPGSTGNESFRSGGRVLNFPGSGLFIPERPGTVQRNGGGMTINHSPVYNIQTGADPQIVARIVDQKNREFLQMVIGS